MPDQPDEVQKPPRRSTALPPFFAPRATRPNTPVRSTPVPAPRRTSLLFTPPSVARQPRPTTPGATPAFQTPSLPPVEPRAEEPIAAPTIAPELLAAAEPDVLAAAEQDVPTAAAAEPTPADELTIEQFEHQPISLHATGEHFAVQDEHSLPSLGDDDAVPRNRASVGGDDFEIERTELTLEPQAGTSRLEVESFWASEAMSAPAPEAAPPELDPDAQALDDAETAEHYAPTEYSADPFELREPPALPAAAALPSAPEEPAATQPPESFLSAAEESVAAVPAEPWLEPAAWPGSGAAAADDPRTPQVDPPAAPPAARDDAEAALEDAFAEPAAPDRPPRWATPHGMAAIAEPYLPPPNDTPVAAPRDELTDALAWPESSSDDAEARDAAGGGVDVADELSASAGAWKAAAASRAAMPDAVAAALERIAHRVRAGDVPLPSDVALLGSDESALAVALAALLRGGTRA